MRFNEFSSYHDFINRICYTLAPYYLLICKDRFLALCSNPRHPAWVPLGTYSYLQVESVPTWGEVHQARVDWRLLAINIKSNPASQLALPPPSKTFAPSLLKIFDSCTCLKGHFICIQNTKKRRQTQNIFANITSVRIKKNPLWGQHGKL